MAQDRADGTEDWLTVKQAAVLLGNVSIALVYRMRDRGRLVARKIEGCVRIERASVERYLAGAETGRKGPQGARGQPPQSKQKTGGSKNGKAPAGGVERYLPWFKG